MRVAALGAGYPALVVARALLDRGHEVDVYGRKEDAGVLSGMGPRHLWDTPKFTSIPLLAKEPLEAIHVRWADGRGGLSTDGARWHSGYWGKSRGSKTGRPPCQGRVKFHVVRRGFAVLDEAFRLSEILPFDGMVTVVTGMPGNWGIERRTHAGESRTRLQYDCIVTTLQPSIFKKLIGARMSFMEAPHATTIHYSWSPIGPVPPPEFDVAGCHHDRTLIYDGSNEIVWHRASWVEAREAWCYESRVQPCVGPYVTETKAAPTQLCRYEPASEAVRFVYPRTVVPVGRFAEWDGEAMVSDVVERLDDYVQEVECCGHRTNGDGPALGDCEAPLTTKGD